MEEGGGEDDDWTTVSKKPKASKTKGQREVIDDSFNNSGFSNPETQDWNVITLKKKSNKKSNNGFVYAKPGINNKQTKPVPNASKIEQGLEDGTYKLPTVTVNFQNQLQQLRQAKGWNQKQLANNCNLSESLIRSYESGKAIPSQQDIDKMSKALGTQLKNK
ncbi:MAG: helix-turn-helix protein [Barrevirus sp.]|uniref:Helix-turn-helix protein n=1 Tax=Barrevirus sp. TaxID=2487763 RepID=A0A3G4ZSN4_9VIRU|nr:MAG: helix-turn-helix protein [Barrevirus sp.]